MKAQEAVHSKRRACTCSTREAAKGGGHCCTDSSQRSGEDVGASEPVGVLGVV